MKIWFIFETITIDKIVKTKNNTKLQVMLNLYKLKFQLDHKKNLKYCKIKVLNSH